MNSNPWFWGEHTSRWTFERELEKTAVHLRDKNARVVVKKVNIEDVKARKNALAAKGVTLKTLVNVSVGRVTGSIEPRKIK